MDTNPVAFLQSENNRLKDENDRLKSEVRNLRDFVRFLDGLADAPSRIQDDSELLPLLNEIFTKAMNVINAPDGSLLLLDQEKNELAFVLVHGKLASDLTGFRIKADQGIAGWVVHNAKSALVRDVRLDNRFSDLIDDAFKFRTQSIAAVPLIGDHRVLGVLEALNQPGDQPFSADDMALLNLVCRFAGEALADIEQRPT